MIVLRSPKGWTGPARVHDRKVEGFWRAHQVPLANPRQDPEELRLLEDWLRSYRPGELFDSEGRLVPEIKALSPLGTRRMGSNPHANGGVLRRKLRLPPMEAYAVAVPAPGQVEAEIPIPWGRPCATRSRPTPIPCVFLGRMKPLPTACRPSMR